MSTKQVIKIEDDNFTEIQYFDFTDKNIKERLAQLNKYTRDEYFNNYSMETALMNNCNYDDFISHGEYTMCYGESMPIFSITGNAEGYWLVDENMIYFLTSYFNDISLLVKNKKYNKFAPSAVIVPYNKKRTPNTYFFLLLNADIDDSADFSTPDGYLVDEFSGYDFPSLSFGCLSRFYDTEKMESVCKRLVDGNIEVIDYCPDERVKLTKEEKATLTKWLRGKQQTECPLVGKPGYTLLDDTEWHRPSTILLYDHKYKFSLLLGMDEGSYFGVQLSDNPKTLEKAYLSLTPKTCRNINGVRRQGEWFAKPETDIPPIEECCVIIRVIDDESLALNRDSEESSRHYLTGDECRIKDNIVYAYNPVLEHENGEHSNLELCGWYSFHRNTAVRSFSVQGVD